MSSGLISLLYCSRAVPAGAETHGTILGDILRTARANNARDGLTGALLFANESFAQILEGPADAVERTFAQVRLDPRHCDIVVLANSPIAAREFPDWSMALSINGPVATKQAPAVFRRAFAGPDETAAPEVADLIRKGISAVQIW